MNERQGDSTEGQIFIKSLYMPGIILQHPIWYEPIFSHGIFLNDFNSGNTCLE